MASALPVEAETKRKPNFTDAEKLFLVQQYELYKPILSSRLCDGVTNRQKQDIWLKITAELNARNPHVDRTTKDVKKKWENLATQARKEMIDYRQNAGQSMVTPPSVITLKVLELLDDAPLPTRSSCHSKREYDYDDAADQQLSDQGFGVASNGLDEQDSGADHDSLAQPAIEEIDAGNDAATSDSAVMDNEPSLQALMGLWRQKQQVTAPILDCGTSASTDEARSPKATHNGRTPRNYQEHNRRRRRDDFEDSDSNPSPNIQRNDVKRLKRLKLLLETEKLMLEKKKLELEILVLNNQLRKNTS